MDTQARQMEDLAAILRLRGTLDTAEDSYIYYIMSGSIYADIPGKPAKKLFNIHGVNKGRVFKKEEGKYMLNSKEVVFYEHPDTGETLETWTNPFTEEVNEVFPVCNDPVNIPFFAAFLEPAKKLSSGNIALFNVTVPLCRPNPLSVEEFPEYSTGDFYIGSECFDCLAWAKDLYDAEKCSVPGTILWTRTSPWLPWMKMGKERQGRLFYAALGWKGFAYEEIPLSLRRNIERFSPSFINCPAPLTSANQSSWTTFKDAITKRRQNGEAEIQLGDTTGKAAVGNSRKMAAAVSASDPCLEYLRDAAFNFSVTGKAFVVGSTQRRVPYKLQGEAIVNTNVHNCGISVSVKYTVYICDSKSGLPVNKSTTKSQGSEVSDTVETEVQFCDVQADFFDNIRVFSLLVKNTALSSIQAICLLFPKWDSLPSKTCLSSTFTIPLPTWIEKDQPESYLLLNMSG